MDSHSSSNCSLSNSGSETNANNDSDNIWNSRESNDEANSDEDNLHLCLPDDCSETDDWNSTPSYNPELIDVKLRISNQLVNLKLTDNMIIQDVSDIVGDMFGVIDDRLSLEFNGETLEPYRTLKALASNRELELKVVLCTSHDLLSTEFEKNNIKQYQNISVQTKIRKQMVSRITQTPCFPLVDVATNTPHTKQIQVDHVINPSDKVLIPQEYVMYETLVQSQNDQAVMIQKSIRRFLAQKRIIHMKKERDLMLLQSQLQMEEVTHDKLKQELKEILEKRSIPCHDDFSKAYLALAEWLKKEKGKLQKLKGDGRKAAMNELFKKEMESLNFINQIRMSNQDHKEYKYKSNIVKKASKPIARIYPKGHKTTIERDDTEIAKLFNETLRNMKKSGISKEERTLFLKQLIDLLVHLNAPECTNEMIELAEKELQMMLLGVNNKNLEGSRKRLLELFIHFSISPEFNPAIKRVTKSIDLSSLLQCRVCRELKNPSDFNVDILRGLTDCTSCTVRRELSQSNMSLIPYKALQKEVYSTEQKQGLQGDYVTLMQPPDFYYLVQIIWEGRSCLSEVSDIKLLKFVRWDHENEWTPWNCILLTGKEVELHLSIVEKHTFYGQHFIKKIQNKHLQAKIKFKKLELLYQKMKMGIEENEDTGSSNIEMECPLLTNIVNLKTKKINTKFIFTEPISDLIFP